MTKLPTQNTLINFNVCDTVILVGGGEILREISKFVLFQKRQVKVLTSPRQLKEKIEDKTLEEFLIINEIPFINLTSLDSKVIKEFCGDISSSFILSLGAAWIFDKEVITNVFNNKIVNLHGTRLPQDRGGGGHSWRILMGNRFGFLTLHLIDEGVDTGPIIFQEEFLYPSSCRIPNDYESFYLDRCVKFFKVFLANLFSHPQSFPLIKQSETFATYWPRLNSNINSWIDWSMEPKQLERFICAFDDPYLGAQTMSDGKVVRIKKVSINLSDGIFHPFQRGVVYRKGDNWICVALNGCGLIIEEISDLNGDDIFNQVKVGSRFYTPVDNLEKSLSKKIIYSASGLLE